MKVTSIVMIASCAAALSGCVAHDHHHRPRTTKVVVPAVVVPVPVVVAPRPAKHCPPGQAKKGNC